MIYSKRDKYVMFLFISSVFYLVYRANHPYIDNGMLYDIIMCNFVVLYGCSLYFFRMGFMMTTSRLLDYLKHDILEYKCFYDAYSDIVDRCYVRVVSDVYDSKSSYYSTDKEYSSWYLLDIQLINDNNEFIKLNKLSEFVNSNGNVEKLLDSLRRSTIGNKLYSSYKVSYDTSKVMFCMFAFIFVFVEVIAFISEYRGL